MRWTLVVLAIAVPACDRAREQPSSAPAAAPSAPAATAAPTVHTPNEFFAAGTPTFVAGTSGADKADRAIAGQIALVRHLFPRAVVTTDVEIAGRWPERPVLYGGPHVNTAAQAADLPFQLEAGRLAIGGEDLRGEEFQIIATIPASPAHPEILLYAGTGTPGVAEINGVRHGGDPIVIADRFGPLRTGTWKRQGDGTLAVELSPPARRIEWRTQEQTSPLPVRVHVPAMIAPVDGDAAAIAAVLRGVARAAERLRASPGDTPLAVDVYVYPDSRSKQSLTGNAGDGHAVATAHALHVVRVAPAALENLIAHEAVHIYAHDAWGVPGTAFLGEGLAVWVSGQYGGRSLDEWKTALAGRPAIADLLGPEFRRVSEATAYPLAGLTVAAAIERIGIDGVRDHLYRATAETWNEACARAGLRAADLEAALPAR